MATHSSILAWRIPWREEPGYSPWGHKESDTSERATSLSLSFHAIFIDGRSYDHRWPVSEKHSANQDSGYRTVHHPLGFWRVLFFFPFLKINYI